MPQPVLLTYRVPAKHAAKLRVLAVRMGIRVRAVEKWEYIQPVGSFTGDCEGFESFYDGEGFSRCSSWRIFRSPYSAAFYRSCAPRGSYFRSNAC